MELPAPTARLVFRAWSAGDLALARALWGDPKVTALIGGPLSDAEIQQRLDAELERGRTDGLQYWPIFLAEGGALVGCCGLRPKAPERRVLELGFHLLPEFWGRGLAVEAASAVIRHAFDRCGAEALFAGHHPENVASRKTLGKLGFRHSHDELYPPTGRMHPSYALTRAEFLRSRAFASLVDLGAEAPEVLVEQPRWSMVKRRADGRVDFVSPLPCPYNYGSIPGRLSGDGDPLDALLLGPRRAAGSRVRAPVVGVVGFVDAGELDPKVVCSVRPLTARDRAGLLAFFATYARFKSLLSLARGRRGETRSLGFLPDEVWRRA